MGFFFFFTGLMGFLIQMMGFFVGLGFFVGFLLFRIQNV